MGLVVDLDDLLNAEQAAAEVGVSSAKSLAACRAKPVGAWLDFPQPVFDGRYWWRPHLREWDERHPNRRKRGRPSNVSR